MEPSFQHNDENPKTDSLLSRLAERVVTLEKEFKQLAGLCQQLQGDLNDMFTMLKRFGEEFRDALKKAVGKETKVEMQLPPTIQDPLPVQCNRCGALMENRHKHAKQWEDGSWYCLKCWPLVAK